MTLKTKQNKTKPHHIHLDFVKAKKLQLLQSICVQIFYCRVFTLQFKVPQGNCCCDLDLYINLFALASSGRNVVKCLQSRLDKTDILMFLTKQIQKLAQRTQQERGSLNKYEQLLKLLQVKLSFLFCHQQLINNQSCLTENGDKIVCVSRKTKLFVIAYICAIGSLTAKELCMQRRSDPATFL